jgi:RND superfamily putative drug exporter
MISPLLADIGFAVAAGVLISAFINAFLLVPALTVIAGRAAWWPSHPGAQHGSAVTGPDGLPSIHAPRAATATK